MEHTKKACNPIHLILRREGFNMNQTESESILEMS